MFGLTNLDRPFVARLIQFHHPHALGRIQICLDIYLALVYAYPYYKFSPGVMWVSKSPGRRAGWAPVSGCSPEVCPCSSSLPVTRSNKEYKTTLRLLRSRTKTSGVPTRTEPVTRRQGFRIDHRDNRCQRDDTFLILIQNNLGILSQATNANILKELESNSEKKMAHLHLRYLLALALVHVVSWLPLYVLIRSS